MHTHKQLHPRQCSPLRTYYWLGSRRGNQNHSRWPEMCGYSYRNGKSQRTHLCLSGVLRNVLFVPLVFDKVGLARPNFRVINPATLKFKTEIHIDHEETQVQPPGEKVWITLGETETDVHTGCPQELNPSLEEGCNQDGDRLDIPA